MVRYRAISCSSTVSHRFYRLIVPYHRVPHHILPSHPTPFHPTPSHHYTTHTALHPIQSHPILSHAITTQHYTIPTPSPPILSPPIAPHRIAPHSIPSRQAGTRQCGHGCTTYWPPRDRATLLRGPPRTTLAEWLRTPSRRSGTPTRRISRLTSREGGWGCVFSVYYACLC